jgi:DNA-binding NtrC family response regulator
MSSSRGVALVIDLDRRAAETIREFGTGGKMTVITASAPEEAAHLIRSRTWTLIFVGSTFFPIQGRRPMEFIHKNCAGTPIIELIDAATFQRSRFAAATLVKPVTEPGFFHAVAAAGVILAPGSVADDDEKLQNLDYDSFLEQAIDPIEKRYFAAHLAATSGNVVEVAKRTRLDRKTIYNKLARLSMDPADFRK